MSHFRHGRLRRIPLTLLGAAAISLGAAGVAHAATATFTVDSTTEAPLANSAGTTCVSSDTAGNCTLRAAVQAADNIGGSSTITLPAGTYKYTIAATSADDPANGDLDITNTSSITLTGAGSSTTTIDANNLDRAFSIDAGSSLSLSGITIEHGSASSLSTAGDNYGGAIYDAGGLSIGGDVVFRGDSAHEFGGAIYAAGGSTLSLKGATFDADLGDGNGGAIYDDTSNPVSITDSVFDANGGVVYGGAIIGEGGDMTITDSTFDQNASNEDGDAIYWQSASSTLDVSHSTFSGNGGGDDGGAIYDKASAGMTFTDDLFTDNSTGSEGGALFLDSSSTTAYVLTGDEFDGNTSGSEGGAILWLSGSLDVHDSSFVDNNGTYNGGAIDAGTDEPFTLVDSTLADNEAGDGGGVYLETSVPVSWSGDTIAFNTAGFGNSYATGGGVYNATAATTSGYTAPAGGSETAGITDTLIAESDSGDCSASSPFSTTVDLGHNLDSDGSCFNSSVSSDKTNVSPKLSQPADNGGPVAGDPNGTTETLQTVAELTGSPSIGAGSGCQPTDERGVSGSCDMGAYQTAAAKLALSVSAPAKVTQNAGYEETLKVSDSGPAASTATTVTDTLPANTTVYAASSPEGSCTVSGQSVSCALGVLDSGSADTVTLVLSNAKTGTVTDTAKAANAQASSATASTTTTVASATPVAKQVAKPKASTGKASKITRSSAKLAGKVTVGSQTTIVFFQYGTSRSFGQSTKTVKETKNVSLTTTIKALKAGSTYHYRLVAVNASGVSYGAGHTLKTKKPAKKHKK